MTEPLIDRVWRGATEGRFDPSADEPSLAEGQDLQLQLLERWRQRGESVGGWKLGMTWG